MLHTKVSIVEPYLKHEYPIFLLKISQCYILTTCTLKKPVLWRYILEIVCFRFAKPSLQCLQSPSVTIKLFTHGSQLC